MSESSEQQQQPEQQAAEVTTIDQTFRNYRDKINEEQLKREQIRDVVKILEESARELLTNLQRCHHEINWDFLEADLEVKESNNSLWTKITEAYADLSKMIDKEHYYKHHDQFRFVTQRITFIYALNYFLKFGDLVQPCQVVEMLGIQSSRENGFHLELEDYLSGILQLANELSRLAINSVAAGDTRRPFEISAFINRLDGGFRLLNLKNDFLRKKVDAFKYDVQRVESVVYDLTIRGVAKPAANTSTAEASDN